MTLQELVELYILQKNFHLSKSREDEEKFFKRYDEIYHKLQITAQEVMAPKCYSEQTDIPFVLLRPQISYMQKRPLIIHTHGGPHVCFTKNTRHVEVLYYLSQGYVVACPNYRGSLNELSLHEDMLKEWLKWKGVIMGYFQTGAEDVCAVATYMQRQQYIIRERTVLCGRSFGSYINSFIAKRIGIHGAAMFAGMHLSGSKHYPDAYSFPISMPILITHGAKDDVATLPYAKKFMADLLLKQLSYESKGGESRHVQTYIAEHGGHHMIAPTLELGDSQSPEYLELLDYFSLVSKFLRNVLTGDEPFISENTRDQYKRVMTRQASKVVDADEEINWQLCAYQYVYNMAFNTAKANQRRFQSWTTQRLCPTMAHLKLQLGDRYTSHIERDLGLFFREYYQPVVWGDEKIKDKLVGKAIASNAELMGQFVSMIRKEEGYLHEHPNHMVMYHAGELNVLWMYTFINMWLRVLRDRSAKVGRTLSEMRLFDCIKKSMDNIHDFLQVMRANKHLNKYFNYVPGFNERAVAFTLGLTFNPHNTASSPVWIYHKGQINHRLDILSIISIFFKLLGIYSEERVKRYTRLFTLDIEKTDLYGFDQAVMQQVFVPFSDADEYGYACQIWGEEFNANTLNLDKPSCIKLFCEDPVKFEEQLRGQPYAFTNHGDCPAFGKIDEGFNYSAVLQARFMVNANVSMHVNTYVKEEYQYERFREELATLIEADYVDFIASTGHLSGAIVEGLDKRRAEHQKKAGFFKPFKTSMNVDELKLHQFELRQGMVSDATQPWHWDVLRVDEESRLVVQIKLQAEPCKKFYLLSLCVHLQGYTYYELLMEAANLIYQIRMNSPR